MVRMFTPHKLGCNRQSIGKKCFYFHKITKDQSYLDKCRFFSTRQSTGHVIVLSTHMVAMTYNVWLK